MRFFEDSAAAYRAAASLPKSSSLFIDSDVGLRKFITLARLKIGSSSTKICVYEEGIGTYRSDLYPFHKRLILRSVGAGAIFGQSSLTECIFVYDCEKYKSISGLKAERVCKIEDDLSTFIRSNRAFLSYLFDAPSQPTWGDEKHYNVYLSDWVIHPQIVCRLKARPEKLLIKPHPHVKKIETPESYGLDSDAFLPAGVPAELLLEMLLAKCPSINVYHHGSSAAYYLCTSGIRFIRL